MDKKIYSVVLIGVMVLVLGFSQITAAKNDKPPKSSDVEKIEFIHWKKDFAKPNAGKTNPSTTCYKFLTSQKVKWAAWPVNYFINATGSNLASTFVWDAIASSAETWDAVLLNKDLFGAYTDDSSAKYGIRDNKNSIVFGDYPNSGVIAVTSVWYYKLTREIVEFDMEFNTDYVWGNAKENSPVMDLQNIATHEFGHAIGLGDLYNATCSSVTMYGYSNYGETDKRDLEQPDINGLLALYEI